ncbi:hypothetical protein ABER61_08055 [Brevibacillus formosus]|uniref:Uncharacterized protein n=1 Tax=Brevibacillus formosus TaxID=54913 RepID=A0A837KJJ2_9BACL|nr:hypothetical protein [Brevibacillus formosus]KLH97618.1 hypothetical protein AA984_17190 [Brevibacillus formosus]MED1957591.1 hypothetical protein [Brevibacillus formosus]PSJ98975.1 hypothetical protein C7R91_06210 [Brevibacillus formosus]
MRGTGLNRVLTILTNMEQNGTERHVKNACKEWLLASRSVIDSMIDVLQDEQDRPRAQKINISKE